MLPLAKPDIARTLFALRSIACACFSRIFCAVFRCFLFCLLVVLVVFSSAASSFCFRPRRLCCCASSRFVFFFFNRVLSFERNPFISSRALLERRNVFTSSSLKRLAMMIFLALYSRAQRLLGARKSPTKNSAAFLETQSNESAFVVWREDRETFPENDAFRMKDTHAQHQTDSG